MASMHPITRYLRRTRQTAAELAERAGVHPSIISRLQTGARARCSVVTALLIERATRGEVTLRQLVAVRDA